MEGCWSGRATIPRELWNLAATAELVPLMNESEDADGGSRVVKAPNRQLDFIFAEIQNWWKHDLNDVSHTAVIVPIPKKGDLRLIGNYRGIAIVSTLVKLLCTVLQVLLERIVETHTLFAENRLALDVRKKLWHKL